MPASNANADRGLRAAAAMSAWTVVAAFGAYFCTYGFRKPFTAATFAGQEAFGLDYKTVLVTAQVLGYTLSKFIGIRVIAECRPERRAVGIVLLVAIALAAWLAFPLVPSPFNLLLAFANGLPLGMVFGLILGFLEGRRVTEALTAGLCASFILGDGASKWLGGQLLNWGVSELWMPAVAAAIAGVPLLVFVGMLSRVPAPTAADVVHRAPRAPMSRDDRRRFLAQFAPGLAMLTLAYLLVTVLRSVRADFAPEIWGDLTDSINPQVYFWTETLVALGVVVASGLAICIANNRTAFQVALATSIGGLALVVVAVVARQAGWLDGFAFMSAIGLGLYLPYVAVHTTIFERLIAMTRAQANIGYLMYLVDAFGYLGYVAVMLSRTILRPGGSFLAFFEGLSLVVAIGGAATFGLAWFAFVARPRAATQTAA